MKWTRASERLPEVETRVAIKFDGILEEVGYFNGKMFRYGDEQITELGKKHFHRIEWLDESPESSVWPGEELNDSILYFMDWVIKNVWFVDDEYYIKGLGYTSYSKPELLGYFKEQNPYWLQSRTAVKAEVPHRSPEEILVMKFTHYDDPNLPENERWIGEIEGKSGFVESGGSIADCTIELGKSLMILELYEAQKAGKPKPEYHSKFTTFKNNHQSQPTAGGVKEEGNDEEIRCKICGGELSIRLDTVPTWCRKCEMHTIRTN